MLRDRRIQPANHRLKIVCARRIGKGRYSSRNRIPNQIRVLENPRGGDLDGRHEHHIPGRRQAANGSVSRLYPAPTADSPNTNTGTSAPSSSASSCKRARGQFSPHRRFNTSNVVAASELPPPSPPPSGRRFSSVISAPRRTAPACCSKRAARSVRSAAVRHPRNLVYPRDDAVRAHRKMQGVAKIDEAKHGLQQMVAVGSAGPSRAASD